LSRAISTARSTLVPFEKRNYFNTPRKQPLAPEQDTDKKLLEMQKRFRSQLQLKIADDKEEIKKIESLFEQQRSATPIASLKRSISSRNTRSLPRQAMTLDPEN